MHVLILGLCQKCGYISSQAICKACIMLEGLNTGVPGYVLYSIIFILLYMIFIKKVISKISYWV